jgi:hypothetical protein
LGLGRSPTHGLHTYLAPAIVKSHPLPHDNHTDLLRAIIRGITLLLRAVHWRGAGALWTCPLFLNEFQDFSPGVTPPHTAGSDRESARSPSRPVDKGDIILARQDAQS